MQLGARGGVAVLAGVLASCQAPVPDAAPRATTTVTATTAHDGRSSTSPITPIDWGGAGDCLDQLRLVHTTARSGRLEQAHAPPFAVVLVTPTTSLDWVRAPTVPLVADLPLETYEEQAAAAAVAPCLLLVEQPSDLRTAHRVIVFSECSFTLPDWRPHREEPGLRRRAGARARRRARRRQARPRHPPGRRSDARSGRAPGGWRDRHLRRSRRG
jgi:hypothetical protein